MTDWTKLKVADLKIELKNRSLPQTGVKAVLVERLVAADGGNGSESESTLQGDASKVDGDSATSPDDISPILPSTSDFLPETNVQVQEGDEAAELQPTADEAEVHEVEQPDLQAPENKTESELQTDATFGNPSISQPASTQTLESKTQSISQAESTFETPSNSQPVHTVESSQTPAPNDTHHSALPSVEPREAIEDRQKRKRRSQSPPPSATDAAHKRLRIDDVENSREEEFVTSAADTTWVDKHNGVDAADLNAEAKEVADAGEGVETGPTIVDTSMEGVVVDKVAQEVEEAPSGDVQAEKMDTDSPVKEEEKHTLYDESPSRPRDSRFKTLFSGERSTQTHTSRDLNEELEPDRIIGPAIHPATSGLYISNLMRPINSAQFQAHLASLAAPPDSKADPDSIVDFYIDTIRTHAFVSFTTVAAAARVRSALHDRIWPDEKTRKPLWIDFVPADKIVEWIDQEQKNNAGGRSMAKKWEVIYDQDQDRHVTAVLREVNGNAFGRPMPPNRQPSIPNSRDQAPVQPKPFSAPSGPRSFQSAPPTTNRLDEIFKSTTAMPKLYWQPVPREVANRRLDNFDAALSKDAVDRRPIDGEHNRYTFEDTDQLVDRGKEIFLGIRPPPGHRRGGGGHRGGGRGGGYRGGDRRGVDTYRAGDSYRGGGMGARPPEYYRSDRRDSHGRR